MILSKKSKFIFSGFFRLVSIVLILIVASCCHNVNIPQLDYPTLLSFDQFTKRLNTGDIILFHGDSDFDGVTDYLECSPWAHVGMIINGENNKTYLWESTIKSNVKDVIDLETKGGPQLVLLKDRLTNDVVIKDHSGWAFRKLKVSDALRSSFDEALEQIISIEHEKDIPSAVGVFLEVALGRYLKTETNEQKIFCSELMVLTYMQMGLVSKDAIPNGYEPKDFSSGSHKLKFLQQETTLSKEYYFKPVIVDGQLSVRVTSD
ncbi:MAG: hypothetical protein MI892_32115 [Desulfobacterales bacterium]|nr:hypothetical protein [Desulfobacterales bacterium]